MHRGEENMGGMLGVHEGGQARVVQKYSFNNKERKGYKTSNDRKKERMMEGSRGEGMRR